MITESTRGLVCFALLGEFMQTFGEDGEDFDDTAEAKTLASAEISLKILNT